MGPDDVTVGCYPCHVNNLGVSVCRELVSIPTNNPPPMPGDGVLADPFEAGRHLRLCREIVANAISRCLRDL